MWLKIFGAVVVLVGIIFVFDGERIVKENYKDMKDNKDAIKGIKILGTFLSIIGGILVTINS